MSPLDAVAGVLLIAGGAAVASGALPLDTAHATLGRIAPLIAFLAGVIVLAELATAADLFDVIAVRLTIAARGRNAALFAMCFAFATVTTVFLNLDTTAVLVTPVMLATARRSGVPPLPLAMTTVWLANAASILLPVSNLTNLLAADRIGAHEDPVDFALRMALPQLTVLAVVAASLWMCYWRRNPARYEPPDPLYPRNPRTYAAAAVVVLAFIGGIIAGINITLDAVAAAAVLVLAYAIGNRPALSWRLLPWRLAALVVGLFLVMATLSAHGLQTVMTTLIGTDPGASGAFRAAATGAGLGNLLNNLPVYVAGEAAIPVAHHTQLIALLIGTNVGVIVTPWAALATLLWAQHCRAAELAVPWRRFVLTGAATAIIAVPAAVAVLLAT